MNLLLLPTSNLTYPSFLSLDLDHHNYYTRCELFSIYYEAHDVLDHIDATYDEATPNPTEFKWKKIDVVVRTCLYMTFSQNLINTVIITTNNINLHDLLLMCHQQPIHIGSSSLRQSNLSEPHGLTTLSGPIEIIDNSKDAWSTSTTTTYLHHSCCFRLLFWSIFESENFIKYIASLGMV